MLSYEVYLFDADDTLFDFGKAEENALSQTFKMHDLRYSNQILENYRQISNELWEMLEKQEISLSELQIKRFSRLFNECGVDDDARSFNAKYLVELGKGAFLLDGAFEICKALCEHEKRIYIVTNGISITQKTRLEKSDINRFISGLFVSEDIGFQKPHPEYFENVFSYIGRTEKDRIIIVGDSLTADIKGGYNSGIDTCWFNPHKKENHTGITPTYVVHELSEIDSLSCEV